MLERELFGSDSTPGVFGHEQGATVFLDEVGELPPALQARLLVAMEEADDRVRVVAATESDLQLAVDAGRMRDDLFYRLSVITLRVPTLRERSDDIPLLAMHFVKQYAVRERKYIRGFSDRALGVLMGFDWPGNVRQLEASIEHAVVLCRDREIEPRDLPSELMQPQRPANQAPVVPGSTLAEIERHAILETLEHVGGSTRRTAQILGISARKVQYRLHEYRERDPSGVPAVSRTSADSGATQRTKTTSAARPQADPTK